MSKKKVVYQNWIVELGFDPAKFCYKEFDITDSEKTDKAVKAVRESLDKLNDDEKEIIIHYHFMGQSYAEISEKSNREIFKLASLHNRALKKLKKKLSKFVENNYGIKSDSDIVCPICNHGRKTEINEIIFRRDRTKTWKPVLNILKDKYSIILKSPQILIGHEKYHM